MKLILISLERILIASKPNEEFTILWRKIPSEVIAVDIIKFNNQKVYYRASDCKSSDEDAVEVWDTWFDSITEFRKFFTEKGGEFVIYRTKE